MRKVWVAALGLCLLPSAAPAGGATTGPALGPAEVGALLSGNTLDGESQLDRFLGKPEGQFVVHLRTDGSLVIRRHNGKTDDGSWEITDDGLYCSQYNHTRMGMKRCYRVLPRPDGRYALEDTSKDSISTLFTTRPGNPEGL